MITVASAINATGNDEITLADAEDLIVLKGIDVAGTLRWYVQFNDGAALSTSS